MIEAGFILFSLFTIASAVGVVFARSAVFSAGSLILSFFGLSAIYVMWSATFIAMIQILIYAGAIVVLFVFVVMLLDLGHGAGSHSHSWITVLCSGAGVWFFSLLLLRTFNHAPIGGTYPPAVGNDMRLISRLLFSDYLWPFEVLSIFLLALMVAIYALTRPDAKKAAKAVTPQAKDRAKQILAKPSTEGGLT